MDYKDKYEKAFERAKKWYYAPNVDKIPTYANRVIEEIFPELKELEDERIRKWLIGYFQRNKVAENIKTNDIIAWLEKQGCQDNAEDVDILHRVSFYSYIDEPNVLYLSGLYVNEECRNKGIGTKILKIADEVATRMNCNLIRLKTEIGSNAERLYKKNGYTILKEESGNVWLEKQGEQKPEENSFKSDSIEKAICKAGYEWSEDTHQLKKAKPKFKVGDWVVTDKGNVVRVKSIDSNYYILENTMRFTIDYVDKCWHLWSINDAKDGDVLANDNNILIFKESVYDWSSNGTPNSVEAYCGIKPNGNFEIGKDNWCFCGTLHIHPATKEQRDTLFAKMRDARYEWNAEKKELKII